MSVLCPCGLEGADCDQLVTPLSNASLAKACIFSQTEECVVNADEAICECLCGFDGDICDDRLSPEPYNLILGYFFAVGFVVLSIGLLQLPREVKENQLKQDFIVSRISFFSPKLILIYRILGFIIFWPVAIDFAVTKPDDFLSFSLINWVLFGFFNLIGAILSFQGLRNEVDEKEKVGVLENIFIATQAIILPASFFLTVIYWIVIVPGADEDDIDRLTRASQFFVHGVNVLWLGLEFFFNGTFIKKFQLLYIFIFSGSYVVFHQYLIVYYESRGEAPCPIYDFLDMSQNIYMVNVFGLLIAFTVIFFITYGFSVLKKKQF